MDESHSLTFYVIYLLLLGTEHGPLGMESKQISDNQLKASSFLIFWTFCLPQTARANLDFSSPLCPGWVPEPETALGHWIQVSFPVSFTL